MNHQEIRINRKYFESLKPFLANTSFEVLINKDLAILRIHPDELVIAQNALKEQEQNDFYHSACLVI
ncbi:hypothetical protein ACJCFO_002864 [Acinetobacter baumannii]|uniref:hypothetical protein n=1 Tax=Acinetobacter baumannii TaxID=470 RepID=UPI001DF6892A|nr:hypothetical protein [Acinetobacter baumannii]EKU8237879.1 hypothetical protein [Acinetobacter baumannii]EKU8309805.1 hypothetical protein [Acinetobacter baumannii]EKU8413588.1 hypothetical protein [Acinetobacter baumannii]EKU9263378.1 hypothetical protein [Acinetobacter baumannii]